MTANSQSSRYFVYSQKFQQVLCNSCVILLGFRR
jgi:hypothetical protein